MWGDEAAERHEMNEPMDPLREDGSPRLPTTTPENAVCSACDWEGDADKLEDQSKCPKCGQDELNFFTPGGVA